MALWAERIQPIDTGELPPALMASLQAYKDPQLALLPFTQIRHPLSTDYMPRAPRQPDRPGHCPSSALDLLTPPA
eukprot:924968-Pleurochrysis_carterae.AAC.1